MQSSINNLIFGKEVYVRLISVMDEEDDVISQEAYSQVKKLAFEMYGDGNWTIVKSVTGKPNFIYNDKYFMSVSHTDNLIAVAVCKGYSIGIDIEKIHKISEKLIDKYYTEDEKNMISLNVMDKEKEEVKIWTLKEAHCKCTGVGLDKCSLRWDSVNDENFFLVSICIGNYIVSVCKG